MHSVTLSPKHVFHHLKNIFRHEKFSYETAELRYHGLKLILVFICFPINNREDTSIGFNSIIYVIISVNIHKI